MAPQCVTNWCLDRTSICDEFSISRVCFLVFCFFFASVQLDCVALWLIFLPDGIFIFIFLNESLLNTSSRTLSSDRRLKATHQRDTRALQPERKTLYYKMTRTDETHTHTAGVVWTLTTDIIWKPVTRCSVYFKTRTKDKLCCILLYGLWNTQPETRVHFI